MIRQKSGRHPELVSGSLLSVFSLASFERGRARRRLRRKTEIVALRATLSSGAPRHLPSKEGLTGGASRIFMPRAAGAPPYGRTEKFEKNFKTPT